MAIIMAKHTPLTQEILHDLFRYNKQVGLLIRRYKRGKAEAGTSSTAKDRDGYLVVGIKGKLYRAHRVIWFYVHGSWPKGDIDHINRVKDDNRIHNLRDVTRSQNKQNQGPSKNCKSGIKGVYWCNQSSKWRAGICHQGRQWVIGEYKTIEAAASAYATEAARVHEFNPMAKKT